MYVYAGIYVYPRNIPIDSYRSFLQKPSGSSSEVAEFTLSGLEVSVPHQLTRVAEGFHARARTRTGRPGSLKS